MRKVITNEAGKIKLGDTLLPGIFISIEVDGKLRIDNKEVPGQSGKSKQPLGFEDAKILLKVRLLTDEDSDCYEKAAVLVGLFQNVDKQAKPYVYRIVNRLLTLWQISEVLFESMKIADSNGADTLTADLEFTEYKPALVQAEAKAQVTATIPSASGLPDAIASGAAPMGGLQSFEERGGLAGNVSGTVKQIVSPAVDDDLGG